ncbi:Stp1/IreP family PP2C-type Ser/Thr phosphatase [Paenibacillus sacheonensis]|uniref:Stp1/IreP family PP2C-type Ser/Thr phosphatase n=2 Tax=Paenibacillus sacheonensis TaxID=742054 RepID=A0A7X4YTB3_9BACL|nr:Stp1/IreP family PP2C-type Ser/Thr phosphatase [Paenibacillus sacheonensis]MBM7563505.1 protein phosphatase [Paenibacillus sacheonensis]NBC71196.1 Stp1/IreP family PP2C-type Ser/Thr phosphatase [Paenibacillus sacheonensis]
MALRSDIGRIRLVNEDRGWCEELEPGLVVAIVADGMGGHQAGDVASRLAVDTFREAVQGSTAALTVDERKTLISQAILQANEVVYDTASNNEQYHNMGTTVVAALLTDANGVIGHIGDSRAYQWRDGVLTQVTEDHTLVNELVKSGQITPEEAAKHPRRNVLTRALGTDEQVEVDVKGISWQKDDLLLICSDGLSSMIDAAAIIETLQQDELDLDQKADRLVQLALQAGGDDNITVILLHHAEDTELEG